MVIINRFFLLIIITIKFYASYGQTQSEFLNEISSYRAKYISDFLTSSNSPLDSASIKFLDFFEPNIDYHVQAKFKKNNNPKPFEMPTSAGTTKTFIEYGKLFFNLENKEFILPIYQNLTLMQNEKFKNHLFLPFTDFTNGSETYGGGRYIDLAIQDIKDGLVVIDFNKAYNPYCAYKDGYRCPVPPRNNALKIEIKAGEKSYANH